MAPKPRTIDATFDIVTPENIAFQYRVAGPFRRLPALLMDLSIKGALIIGFSLAVELAVGAFSQAMSIALTIIAWFILDWFSGGLCEYFFNGQTPGKWLLGLRVVTADGQPINALQAMMRNILRYADLMPPLVGLTVMSMNRRYQRLGDLVCGTMVIVEERHWLTGVVRLDDPRAIQLAAYLPANFVVSRSLAKALATYVERRRFFSQPRRKEVARHVSLPLLERFGLPPDTSYDLLLCALYYRKFIADRGDDERQFAQVAAAARGPVLAPPPAPAYVPPPLPQAQLTGMLPEIRR